MNNYSALGLVEVLGSANAVMVVDQMLKAADVDYMIKNHKCGGHVTVFMTGDVASCTAAVDSVKANPPCEICDSAVISNPSDETRKWIESNIKKSK